MIFEQISNKEQESSQKEVKDIDEIKEYLDCRYNDTHVSKMHYGDY